MDVVIEVLGVAGAVAVVAAFVLSSTRPGRVRPAALAGMNLGAGALAVNGLVHQAWPSAVLNAVWFVAAAVTLRRELRPSARRTGPAAEPAADSARAADVRSLA